MLGIYVKAHGVRGSRGVLSTAHTLSNKASESKAHDVESYSRGQGLSTTHVLAAGPTNQGLTAQSLPVFCGLVSC